MGSSFSFYSSFKCEKNYLCAPEQINKVAVNRLNGWHNTAIASAVVNLF